MVDARCWWIKFQAYPSVVGCADECIIFQYSIILTITMEYKFSFSHTKVADILLLRPLFDTREPVLTAGAKFNQANRMLLPESLKSVQISVLCRWNYFHQHCHRTVIKSILELPPTAACFRHDKTPHPYFNSFKRRYPVILPHVHLTTRNRPHHSREPHNECKSSPYILYF